MMIEKYAIIQGVKHGERKIREFVCPIYWNAFSDSFEFEGAEDIRIVEIEYHWPTRVSDMANMLKARIAREKAAILGQRKTMKDKHKFTNYKNVYKEKLVNESNEFY